MKKMIVGLAIAAALLTGACATEDNSAIEAYDKAAAEAATEQAQAEPVPQDEAAVLDSLGLESPGLLTTQQGTECDVALVLTNPDDIWMYVEAGDTVASNDSGTAGVKLVGKNEDQCGLELSKFLQETFPH